MANSKMMTVADRREEKSWITGDYEAYARDQDIMKRNAAVEKFLRENPEVGELVRDGKPVYYSFASGDYEEIEF